MSHACDQSARWMLSSTPFDSAYEFGCEPYSLYHRSHASRYDEVFVGYGKNRVSAPWRCKNKGEGIWACEAVRVRGYGCVRL